MEKLKEKKQPLISVIVPVYNVEIYLTKCLESIVQQKYNNLEIILVDDGSTDNSGNICDEYASKDDRIVVIHKNNGGLSDARNRGINRAQGEYLTFIDSDDFVSDEYILYLYELILRSDADISVCGYDRVWEKQITHSRPKQNKYIVLNRCRALATLLYQKEFTSSAWAKLYKKNVWKGIRFPMGQLHEDVAVMYLLFAQAKVVVYGDAKHYYYLQRGGSIVNSSFSSKRMDYIIHTQACIDYMKNNHIMLYKAAVSRHFSACCELLAEIPSHNDYEIYREKLYHEIRKYWKIVYKDKYARLINRCAAIIFFICPKVAIQGCKYINDRRKKN